MKDNERQFEDFVASITFDDTPDANHRDKLEQELLRTLAKQAPRQTSVWKIIMKSPITKIAVAAAIILIAVLIGIKFFTGPVEQPEKEFVGPDAPRKDIERREYEPDYDLTPDTELAADRLANELEDIELMLAAGDIDGLVAMLAEAQFDESRVLAANYLAKIGDLRAVKALETLSKEWSGRQADNPFLEAIAAIKSRTESSKPVPTMSVDEKIESLKAQFTPKGVLSGIVTDARTGEPVSDLQISISGPDHERCKTDANGFYHFDKIEEDGEYRIEVKSEEYLGFADYDQMLRVWLRRDVNTVKHLRLNPACMTDIQVVNEDDEPVQNVTVAISSLLSEYGRAIRPAQTTDEDGVVTFGKIEPAETKYVITAIQYNYIRQGDKKEAVGSDYAPARLLLKLNNPDLIEFRQIVLKKGVAVKGYAEYLDGVPAAGLKVSARPYWWHCNHNPPTYEIDPNGYFTIAHVEPGRHTIHIHIARTGGGYSMPAALHTELPQKDNELLFVAVPRKSPEAYVSIRGTITYTGFADGEEPEYVNISAYSPTGGHASAHLSRHREDPNNNIYAFTMDGLEAGTYQLTFRGHKLAEKTIENVKAPGSGLDVELSYQVKPVLEGYVVKAGTDEPIKQFKLRAQRSSSLLLSGGASHDDKWQQSFNADGRFNIEVPGPGVYQVQVMAEGFAPALSADIDTQQPESLVVELAPGGHIKGNVLDEKGKPIDGAKVIPLSKAGGNRFGMFGQFVSEEGAVKTVAGRFLLKNLSPGSETIKVVHPDYCQAVVKDIEVVESQTNEGIKVVLTKGGDVEGYVYDFEGKKQPNVLLFLERADLFGGDAKAGRLATVITDSNGFYRVRGLPEKMCYVRRSQEWNSLGVVRRSFLPVNGKTIRVDLGGKPKISGRMTIDGRPLANTKLLLGDVLNEFAGSYKCNAYTKANGEFVFWGPPPGTWAIYYETSDQLNRRVRVTTIDVDNEDIELGVISPTETADKFLIEVKTADPNEQLENIVQLMVQKGAKITGQVIAQAAPVEGRKGFYAVQDIPPGDYTVTVYRTGHPLIRERLEIREEEEKGVFTLQLPKGSATVSGAIKTDSVIPLVMVSLDERIFGILQPNSDGTYKVEHLPAGRYFVARWPYEGTTSHINLTLNNGENKTLDIDASVLTPSELAFLAIQIVGEDGSMLSEAESWLEAGTEYIEPTQKSTQGHFFMTNPGEYTLHVTCSGYEDVMRDVSLEPVDMENFRPPEPVLIKLKKK